MTWWWLSFAEDTEDGAFLGACVVEAEDFPGACLVARAKGCCPAEGVKAEVQGFALFAYSIPAVLPELRRLNAVDRLLSWSECEAADAAMAATAPPRIPFAAVHTSIFMHRRSFP